MRGYPMQGGRRAEVARENTLGLIKVMGKLSTKPIEDFEERSKLTREYSYLSNHVPHGTLEKLKAIDGASRNALMIKNLVSHGEMCDRGKK